MPSFLATVRAVVRLSPVAITVRMPSAFSAASASAVVALIGSETATIPASCPATARYMTLAPSCRNASPCAAIASHETPACCISAVLPSATARPPTVPRTPMPLLDSKASGLSSESPRSTAARTIAAASGCSLPWSMLAARRSTSSSAWPGAASTRSKDGRPSVRVPVLSTIRVSTRRKFSIAAASRNKTPCVAALPVATMIDIGVARPSAQGHAMMSTATALMRP